MRRPLVLLLAGLFACQDYRFNPVGKCLLQPGQARVSVGDISTADILFVIDDSGSMDPIQTALASNFGAFIQQLVATQAARVAGGKEPIDFHIAVTSSSVFAAFGGTCSPATSTCVTSPTANLAKSCTVGNPCIGLRDQYYDIGARSLPQNQLSCTPNGVSDPRDGDPYPSGDFLAPASGQRVVHFDKNPCGTGSAADCWSGWSAGNATHPISQLIARFQQNVKTGICGSPEEQHLEAARLAVKKALRLDGLSQPSDVQTSEWPHEKSKLVVVWVGNEDDCSNTKDVNTTLFYSGTPGDDMCTQNPSKLTPVAEYAAFFASLSRPFGAAFIRPGDAGCNCTGNSSSCTGYSAGTRFKGLRDAIVAQGNSVVDASVCGTFAGPLQQIADLVKPPDRLNLPSAPAADVVTQLRVQDAGGRTVHVCVGPDPAQEWWFVDCPPAQPNPVTAGTSACILLRPGSACEPGSGQTLLAAYLGRVPADGCASAADCATALGGQASNWTCDGATASIRGTCLCAQP